MVCKPVGCNRVLWSGLALILWAVCGWGCNSGSDVGHTFSLPKPVPELGQAQEVQPGVLVYQVMLPHEGVIEKAFVYLPAKPQTPKLPCVLIAPAGSPLFTGNSMDETDHPERIPYVKAGFAVVAYDLDGPLPEGNGDPSPDDITRAIKAFKRADAGIANARLALDYALAKVPQIDPDRIYTAGHSSAATVALLVAEHDKRIKGCIAYAPVCYLERDLGESRMRILTSLVSDFPAFVHRASPDTDIAYLQCPVFLFHADDDSRVPTEQVTDFANALYKTNTQVTYAHVPTGDHYESMIQEGIPQGIAWLKQLSGAK